jgi:hypothetical protein
MRSLSRTDYHTTALTLPALYTRVCSPDCAMAFAHEADGGDGVGADESEEDR